MSKDDRRNANRRSTSRGSDAAAGLPRWVRRSLIAAAIVGVVMVVVMAISGGHHGPDWHLSGAARASTAAPVLDASGPASASVRW